MPKYYYKGCRISYLVKRDEKNKQLYIANGKVDCLKDEEVIKKPEFYTEYNTKDGAETEIKKLLENYVDFELDQV